MLCLGKVCIYLMHGVFPGSVYTLGVPVRFNFIVGLRLRHDDMMTNCRVLVSAIHSILTKSSDLMSSIYHDQDAIEMENSASRMMTSPIAYGLDNTLHAVPFACSATAPCSWWVLSRWGRCREIFRSARVRGHDKGDTRLATGASASSYDGC